MIGNKQCNNQNEFDSFSKNLGDLNAKSKNWYPLDKTTYESNKIENITSPFGLHQLIHDPIRILGK